VKTGTRVFVVQDNETKSYGNTREERPEADGLYVSVKWDDGFEDGFGNWWHSRDLQTEEEKDGE
jgi:hypothetical protein